MDSAGCSRWGCSLGVSRAQQPFSAPVPAAFSPGTWPQMGRPCPLPRAALMTAPKLMPSAPQGHLPPFLEPSQLP